MSPEDILRRVNHPDIPKFVFGSKELAAWTGDHRNPQNCKCEKYSGPYLVIHRSLNPAKQPDFRVLSCWNVGYNAPHSWDVPAT